MSKTNDVYEVTDGLCEAFEEYAKLEEEGGNYFIANTWRSASNITKSYVGRWDGTKTKKIMKNNTGVVVKDVFAKEEKHQHFGCIPIRVDDL